MTDRKKALTALLAQVKAGTEPAVHGIQGIWDAFQDNERTGLGVLKIRPAFHGSLDAAMSLHGAVMPGSYCPEIDAAPSENGELYWSVTIRDNSSNTPWSVYVECGYHVDWNNPARAWLVCIIEYLLFEETRNAS